MKFTITAQQFKFSTELLILSHPEFDIEYWLNTLYGDGPLNTPMSWNAGPWQPGL